MDQEIVNVFEEAQKENFKDDIKKLLNILPSLPKDLIQLRKEIDSLIDEFNDRTGACSVSFNSLEKDLESLRKQCEILEKNIKDVNDMLNTHDEKLLGMSLEHTTHKKQAKMLYWISIVLFILILFSLGFDEKSIPKLFVVLGSLLGGAF